MDRLREANRRGSLGGGSQISSLRRPRSGGLKDFAAGDEDESLEELHGARLRERSRKDGTVLSISRHKRTRNASRELQPHAGVAEEAQGSEVGASDEDDEIPISPNLLPRKISKFRFHGKVAMEEGNAVEIPTVPRKARTAVLKRSHESFQGDGMRQQSQGYTSQLSSPAVPVCTTQGSALKSMKRTKHHGQKVKAAKHTKVLSSISISEQEVEVAEALFDLARMVSNMGSPLCNDDSKEVKMETGESKGTAWLTSPERTPVHRQDSIPTPPSSHSAVSSPVRGPAPMTQVYIPAFEAPTKKISLSKLNMEDGTPIKAKTDPSSPVKAPLTDSNDGKSAGIKTASTNGSEQISQDPLHDAAPNPVLPGLTNQSSQTSNINVAMINSRPVFPKVENGGLSSHMSSDCDSFLLTACPSEQKAERGKEPNKSPDARDISASMKEINLKTAFRCKDEIDLMAPPNGSAGGAIHKYGNNLESSPLMQNKLPQEQGNDSHASTEKLESQTVVDACITEKEDASPGTEKEAMPSVKPDDHIKVDNSRENETNQQLFQQELVVPVKSSKPDSMKQHSSDGSGWPGNFSQAGYYPSAAAAAAAAAAVAAAWPGTGSVIGAASMEEKGHPGLQVPPFSFPGARPVCKRCATHVYIAHFIDAQQQMQRHPIWTAGGGLYSMKPYNNINAALSPNALFGCGLSGFTGLSVNSSPALKGFKTDPSPQIDKASAPGGREKRASLNMDGVDKKEMFQFSHNGNQDRVAPMQVGLGPIFGYPHTGSSILSAEAERSNALNRGTSAGGAAGAAAASPMDPTGASSSKSESVSAAAVQVQYLQAIIQQAGFPFSFSPGHLIPPATGHVPQNQATQFYGNPFYNAPFVQQGPAAGRKTPEMSSPQGQNTCMHHVSQSSSPQLHQRAGSHFGDLGGEAISSAENKFPGYQKSMPAPETSSMHASGVSSSSSSLYSTGMPVLPAHATSVEGQQAANMKLVRLQSCGQGQGQGQVQLQQHSQKLVSHYPAMGAESMDFQSPQRPSSLQSGSMSKNTVGPGPLGLASVAAIMAPQGHAVLQTMADTQLTHNIYLEQSPRQTHSKYLEGCRAATEISDDNSKYSAVVKADGESESGSRGSLTGLTSAQMQQNFPGVTFNFMTSPVASLGSRQSIISASGAPISIGSMTGGMPSSRPVAVARANSTTNMTAAALESAASNKSASSSIPAHISSVSGHYGGGLSRQGEVAGQISPQMKPVSRSQAGTCVSTPPTMLLSSSYAGVPNTKQLGYSGKNHQPSISSMQSRFPPPACGTSSAAPASPSASVSKSNCGSAMKITQPGKGSLNPSQMQPSDSFGKKPDAIPTHSPGQVVGPNSMTVTMGQQQQQIQHQQIQHAMKQQQQWQQQLKQHHNLHHQEHSQQAPQSVQHQQVAGATPTVVQYHQMAGTNQAGQIGVQKQPAQPQQMKQRLYLEQHFYQQQQLQHQSQLTEAQHTARPSTQHQAARSPLDTATGRPMQQPPSEMQHRQASKNQTIPSLQQPYSMVSFGSPSGVVAPQNSPSISAGIGLAVRPVSSDGASMQVMSPRANMSMKPPVSSAAAAKASDIRRSATPSSGFSIVQGMGGKPADPKLQPQSSSNLSYLPYLHSASFSSLPPMAGKSHGVLHMHSQSGASLKSTREQGREDTCAAHHLSSDASMAPLMTGNNSHSSTAMQTVNGKPSVSQLNTDGKSSASRTPPPVIHGTSEPHVATASTQSNQTCAVMTATMATNSISTTG